MMETKLWIALCALLLVNLGSADHDKEHGAPGVKGATVAPLLVNTMPQLILDHTGHPAPALNDSDTDSRSNGTRVDTTSQTSDPKKQNATSIVSPSAPVPVNNTNLTQTQVLPFKSNTTSPHILTSTTATTTTTTTVGPPHTGDIIPVNATNNASSSTTPLPPDSISPSEQPRLHSSTSVPSTSEPPKPKTTTKTTTSTQHSSTSSTTSSTQASSVVVQTLPSTHTSQSSGSKTQSKSTVATPSSASAQAHADTPSQLNVGGGTTMVHESPTLDPLLAGLVSAFIITAVIITLLLFLKLRRRDNRPEFRRLQDLPMDDMMEDTPLSMYSY